MLAIPYPSNYDHDYHADWRAQREEAIMRSLDPGDVLASVDTLLASQPDPTLHPLYGLVAYLLNQGRSISETQVYYELRKLCTEAIDQCLNDALLQD